MKPRLYYMVLILSMFFLLTSCQKIYKYPSELLQADSLCSTRPDSAVVLLHRFEKWLITYDIETQWYYKLLSLRAYERLGMTVESSQEILKVVQHYEEGKNTGCLFDSYLCAGRMFFSLNDLRQAMSFYHKAQSVLPKKGMLERRSSLYGSMGKLFLQQHLYDDAKRMYHKAYAADSLRNDSTAMAYSLRNIGTACRKSATPDSCLYYYNKSLLLSRNSGNETLECMLLRETAFYHLDRKDYAAAKASVMAAKAMNSRSDTCVRYAILSRVYLKSCSYDSAYHYALAALPNCSVSDKVDVYKDLSQISYIRGNYADASRYMDLFYDYSDSLKNITATALVAQMNSLFDYKEIEAENIQLNLERTYFMSFMYVALCLAVIIIINYPRLFLLNVLRKKKEKQRIAKLEHDMHELNKKIVNADNGQTTVPESSAGKAEAMSEEDENKHSEDDKCPSAVNEPTGKRMAQKEYTDSMIRNSEAYLLICACLEHGRCMQDRDWNVVEQYIYNVIPEFKTTLFGFCFISDYEYHICILIRLGFTVNNISILIGCSASAISKSRTRMYKKFFNKDGDGKKFDAFVRSL